MGLLDKLNSGPTKNAQSLLGQIPATVPGASPSSQTHSQGAFDMAVSYTHLTLPTTD